MTSRAKIRERVARERQSEQLYKFFPGAAAEPQPEPESQEEPSFGDCFIKHANLLLVIESGLLREALSIDDAALVTLLRLMAGPLTPDSVLYDPENWTLVHGLATLAAGPLAGRKYNHCWLELSDPEMPFTVVFDVSNGQETVIPAAVYYAWGRINDSETRSYTGSMVVENLVSSGHYGPWDLPCVVYSAEEEEAQRVWSESLWGDPEPDSLTDAIDTRLRALGARSREVFSPDSSKDSQETA
jgi:hypothetical protein